MKNFKQLRIWQKGMEIAVGAFNLVKSFPKEEKFGLAGQITTSAISISSNIAEGSSRVSERDYQRYLNISLGSCYELETQIMISEAVNYGDKESRDALLLNIREEQKMLTGFIAKLKTS